MKKDQVLQKLRELSPIYAQQGFLIKGIFGSVARDEDTENSDVDILYQYTKKISFNDFLQLEATLEEYIGQKVDLVNIDYANPMIMRKAKKDIIYV